LKNKPALFAFLFIYAIFFHCQLMWAEGIFHHALQQKEFSLGSISISVTVNYEGVICHSAGSPPSLPRPSHPPQWASDGEEPSPHFSIRSDVSPITEIEMLAFP